MGNKSTNTNLVYNKKKNKIEVKSNSKNTKKKKLVNEELENSLEKTVTLSKKEINRKKYQSRQNRYNKDVKKKVLDIDFTIIDNKKEAENSNTNEEQNKKNKKELKKELEKLVVKPEAKTEVKKTINKIKKEEKNEIEIEKKDAKKIKELFKKYWVLENDIPLGRDKENNRIRIKKYLKEAILYAVLITFINMILILFFGNINLLNLFDIMIVNIGVTILLSFIISYIFAFFIDCLVTEIWIIIKNKKEGAANGDKGIDGRKYQKNISKKK